MVVFVLEVVFGVLFILGWMGMFFWLFVIFGVVGIIVFGVEVILFVMIILLDKIGKGVFLGLVAIFFCGVVILGLISLDFVLL